MRNYGGVRGAALGKEIYICPLSKHPCFVKQDTLEVIYVYPFSLVYNFSKKGP